MEKKSYSAKRSGPKSSAQTPAKKSEQKKGSDKNKPGSAGEKGGKITFSDRVLESLKSKVKEHNSKSKKKVTLSQLKKIYRRGAGAFSSSHRPGKSRGQWAMARVNMFLKMVRGGKVKDSYRKADQDVAKASAGVLIDDGVRDEANLFTEEDLITANLDICNHQLQEDPEFSNEMWSTIFIDVDELGFEEYVDEESWASEANKGKKLNKPFRTPKGPKKFSVYVKNEKGNVVKVNFGDPNMEIKRDNPNRRKSFRARHNCADPGPKTKARYWSCKMWSKKSVTNVTKGEENLEEGQEEPSESDAGLWENIQKKKKRMGKNYKPAKPGDKDYPSKEAIKKAQSKKMKKDYAAEDEFKPHMMYDPKTGKAYKAKTLEDHLKMKKMGYTHEKPDPSKAGYQDKKEKS
jgi:hypothetical protein